MSGRWHSHSPSRRPYTGHSPDRGRPRDRSHPPCRQSPTWRSPSRDYGRGDSRPPDYYRAQSDHRSPPDRDQRDQYRQWDRHHEHYGDTRYMYKQYNHSHDSARYRDRDEYSECSRYGKYQSRSDERHNSRHSDYIASREDNQRDRYPDEHYKSEQSSYRASRKTRKKDSYRDNRNDYESEHSSRQTIADSSASSYSRNTLKSPKRDSDKLNTSSASDTNKDTQQRNKYLQRQNTSSKSHNVQHGSSRKIENELLSPASPSILSTSSESVDERIADSANNNNYNDVNNTNEDLKGTKEPIKFHLENLIKDAVRKNEETLDQISQHRNSLPAVVKQPLEKFENTLLPFNKSLQKVALQFENDKPQTSNTTQIDSGKPRSDGKRIKHPLDQEHCSEGNSITPSKNEPEKEAQLSAESEVHKLEINKDNDHLQKVKHCNSIPGSSNKQNVHTDNENFVNEKNDSSVKNYDTICKDSGRASLSENTSSKEKSSKEILSKQFSFEQKDSSNVHSNEHSAGYHKSSGKSGHKVKNDTDHIQLEHPHIDSHNEKQKLNSKARLIKSNSGKAPSHKGESEKKKLTKHKTYTDEKKSHSKSHSKHAQGKQNVHAVGSKKSSVSTKLKKDASQQIKLSSDDQFSVFLGSLQTPAQSKKIKSKPIIAGTDTRDNTYGNISQSKPSDQDIEHSKGKGDVKIKEPRVNRIHVKKKANLLSSSSDSDKFESTSKSKPRRRSIESSSDEEIKHLQAKKNNKITEQHEKQFLKKKKVKLLSTSSESDSDIYNKLGSFLNKNKPNQKTVQNQYDQNKKYDLSKDRPGQKSAKLHNSNTNKLNTFKKNKYPKLKGFVVSSSESSSDSDSFEQSESDSVSQQRPHYSCGKPSTGWLKNVKHVNGRTYFKGIEIYYPQVKITEKDIRNIRKYRKKMKRRVRQVSNENRTGRPNLLIAKDKEMQRVINVTGHEVVADCALSGKQKDHYGTENASKVSDNNNKTVKPESSTNASSCEQNVIDQSYKSVKERGTETTGYNKDSRKHKRFDTIKQLSERNDKYVEIKTVERHISTKHKAFAEENSKQNSVHLATKTDSADKVTTAVEGQLKPVYMVDKVKLSGNKTLNKPRFVDKMSDLSSEKNIDGKKNSGSEKISSKQDITDKIKNVSKPKDNDLTVSVETAEKSIEHKLVSKQDSAKKVKEVSRKKDKVAKMKLTESKSMTQHRVTKEINVKMKDKSQTSNSDNTSVAEVKACDVSCVSESSSTGTSDISFPEFDIGTGNKTEQPEILLSDIHSVFSEDNIENAENNEDYKIKQISETKDNYVILKTAESHLTTKHKTYTKEDSKPNGSNVFVNTIERENYSGTKTDSVDKINIPVEGMSPKEHIKPVDKVKVIKSGNRASIRPVLADKMSDLSSEKDKDVKTKKINSFNPKKISKPNIADKINDASKHSDLTMSGKTSEMSIGHKRVSKLNTAKKVKVSRIYDKTANVKQPESKSLTRHDKSNKNGAHDNMAHMSKESEMVAKGKGIEPKQSRKLGTQFSEKMPKGNTKEVNDMITVNERAHGISVSVEETHAPDNMSGKESSGPDFVCLEGTVDKSQTSDSDSASVLEVKAGDASCIFESSSSSNISILEFDTGTDKHRENPHVRQSGKHSVYFEDNTGNAENQQALISNNNCESEITCESDNPTRTVKIRHVEIMSPVSQSSSVPEMQTVENMVESDDIESSTPYLMDTQKDIDEKCQNELSALHFSFGSDIETLEYALEDEYDATNSQSLLDDSVHNISTTTNALNSLKRKKTVPSESDELFEASQHNNVGEIQNKHKRMRRYSSHHVDKPMQHSSQCHSKANERNIENVSPALPCSIESETQTLEYILESDNTDTNSESLLDDNVKGIHATENNIHSLKRKKDMSGSEEIFKSSTNVDNAQNTQKRIRRYSIQHADKLTQRSNTDSNIQSTAETSLENNTLTSIQVSKSKPRKITKRKASEMRKEHRRPKLTSTSSQHTEYVETGDEADIEDNDSSFLLGSQSETEDNVTATSRHRDPETCLNDPSSSTIETPLTLPLVVHNKQSIDIDQHQTERFVTSTDKHLSQHQHDNIFSILSGELETSRAEPLITENNVMKPNDDLHNAECGALDSVNEDTTVSLPIKKENVTTVKNTNETETKLEPHKSREGELVNNEHSVVKEEPNWLKFGYTQEPDVIFLSDDDEMIMSVSQPVITIDSDSDKELEIQDPEYYDFFSSPEESDGSDFEFDRQDQKDSHTKPILPNDKVNLQNIQNWVDNVPSIDHIKQEELLSKTAESEKTGFLSGDDAIMSVDESVLSGTNVCKENNQTVPNDNDTTDPDQQKECDAEQNHIYLADTQIDSDNPKSTMGDDADNTSNNSSDIILLENTGIQHGHDDFPVSTSNDKTKVDTQVNIDFTSDDEAVMSVDESVLYNDNINGKSSKHNDKDTHIGGKDSNLSLKETKLDEDKDQFSSKDDIEADFSDSSSDIRLLEDIGSAYESETEPDGNTESDINLEVHESDKLLQDGLSTDIELYSDSSFTDPQCNSYFISSKNHNRRPRFAKRLGISYDNIFSEEEESNTVVSMEKSNDCMVNTLIDGNSDECAISDDLPLQYVDAPHFNTTESQNDEIQGDYMAATQIDSCSVQQSVARNQNLDYETMTQLDSNIVEQKQTDRAVDYGAATQYDVSEGEGNDESGPTDVDNDYMALTQVDSEMIKDKYETNSSAPKRLIGKQSLDYVTMTQLESNMIEQKQADMAVDYGTATECDVAENESNNESGHTDADNAYMALTQIDSEMIQDKYETNSSALKRLIGKQNLEYSTVTRLDNKSIEQKQNHSAAEYLVSTQYDVAECESNDEISHNDVDFNDYMALTQVDSERFQKNHKKAEEYQVITPYKVTDARCRNSVKQTVSDSTVVDYMTMTQVDSSSSEIPDDTITSNRIIEHDAEDNSHYPYGLMTQQDLPEVDDAVDSQNDIYDVSTERVHIHSKNEDKQMRDGRVSSRQMTMNEKDTHRDNHTSGFKSKNSVGDTIETDGMDLVFGHTTSADYDPFTAHTQLDIDDFNEEARNIHKSKNESVDTHSKYPIFESAIFNSAVKKVDRAKSSSRSEPAITSQSKTGAIRKTIVIEPQRQKSTADKRTSGKSSLHVTNSSIFSSSEPEILDANISDMWLSTKHKKAAHKSQPIQKRRRTKVDDEANLHSKIMEARGRLAERNFRTITNPSSLVGPHKRLKPSNTVTSEPVEDVELPSDSQIVRSGLPLLNPVGLLVKHGKPSDADAAPRRTSVADTMPASKSVSDNKQPAVSVPKKIVTQSTTAGPATKRPISTGNKRQTSKSVSENKQRSIPVPPSSVAQMSAVRPPTKDRPSTETSKSGSENIWATLSVPVPQVSQPAAARLPTMDHSSTGNDRNRRRSSSGGRGGIDTAPKVNLMTKVPLQQRAESRPILQPSTSVVHEHVPDNVVDVKTQHRWIDFLAFILKWAPNWFEERAKLLKTGSDRAIPPPPVALDFLGKKETLYPLVERYNSFDEYSNKFMLPLLLYETWENSYRSWYERRERGHLYKQKVFFSNMAQAGERLTAEYTLYGIISERERWKGNCVCEGELVLLTLHGKIEFATAKGKKSEMTSLLQLAFVEKVALRETTVENICACNADIAADKQQDSVCLKVVVRVRRRWFYPEEKVTGHIERIGSIVTTMRQFHCLAFLPKSPLCKHILYPTSNPTFCDQAPPAVPALQGGFNSSQSMAINTAAKMVGQPYALPRLCLLQGPPGTGKSHTIVGIINRIIKDSEYTARICLCAPSHAAVDELVRRLERQNKQDRKRSHKAMKIIRLGKPSSVHPDVQSICLDRLVEKNVTQAMKEELMQSLPQSLQGEKRRLDNTINTKRQELATATGFKVQKLQTDLKKLERERDTLERKCNLDVSRLRQDPEKKRRCQHDLICNSHVIAGTLSSIGAGVLKNYFSGRGKENRRQQGFDCVIIDEATQAIELDTLIPLQYGSTKLILVGDPEQLPPTVVSQVALDNKFNLSLFERLDNHFRYSERNPVILLDTQYRMDEEICAFPNNYIYDGKLKTDESVKKRNQMPLVPYLLYDLLDSQELLSQRSGSVSNEKEAEFIVRLCSCITGNSSVIPSVIGIIAPYNKQKSLLMEGLRSRNLGEIEVSTVDGFQGREKHVIIMSCVRAKSSSGSIGFVGNRNRLNVSLTRAKYALYLVGCFESLWANDEWKAVITDARQRKKIVRVDHSTVEQGVLKCLKTSRKSH